MRRKVFVEVRLGDKVVAKSMFIDGDDIYDPGLASEIRGMVRQVEYDSGLRSSTRLDSRDI